MESKKYSSIHNPNSNNFVGLNMEHLITITNVMNSDNLV